MSRKYKFHNKQGMYFVSFATVYWIDVLVREIYFSVITESLVHCRQHKGMEIYCWCIMPSHIHLIFSAKENNPSDLLGRFKEHTSKQLRRTIEENISESRREWILWMMQRAAKKNSSVTNFQFWQHHNKPIELWTKEVTLQKMNYIHNNPVEAGFVTVPEHWKHSSAIDFYGGKALIELDYID